jgi:uncharacterized protein YlzI (FlbEa/FlbD family)
MSAFITLHDADSPKKKWPLGRPVTVRASSIDTIRGYPDGRTRAVVGIHGQFLHVTERESEVLEKIIAAGRRPGRGLA